MSPEAINIVSHLLKLDPQKRLGAGPPGSTNDINALLKHPYFEGIDIKNLEVDEVPLIMPSSIVIQSQHDYQSTSLDKTEFQRLPELKPDIIKEGLLEKRNEWYWK